MCTNDHRPCITSSYFMPQEQGRGIQPVSWSFRRRHCSRPLPLSVCISTLWVALPALFPAGPHSAPCRSCKDIRLFFSSHQHQHINHPGRTPNRLRACLLCEKGERHEKPPGMNDSDSFGDPNTSATVLFNTTSTSASMSGCPWFTINRPTARHKKERTKRR